MQSTFSHTKSSWRPLVKGIAILSAAAIATCIPAIAQEHGDSRIHFFPGNLIVSRSVYDNNANNVKVGALLPPNCTNTVGPCVSATNNGTFPYVFNNALGDSSFGITSKLYLDQITPGGSLLNILEIPNSSMHNIRSESNQLVTSFSSKSEGALNLSTDGKLLTFIDYVAPVNTIEVSNSNTPGVIDPTNPVGVAYYRAAVTLNRNGKFTFTETNAYSGNNGRAAILNDKSGAHVVYAAGNAGNGANPQPNGIIVGAAAQILTSEHEPLAEQQDPGLPTPVGSFNITQLGVKADKIGKDDNFLGLTVFNDVVYYTKGSGGNGINTVYFVDTTGFDSSGKPLACPNGVGLPGATASLPTTPIVYDASMLQTKGVVPYNMCVLKGFSTALKSATSFPFGVWFADAKTLYVSDEGDGTPTYDPAAAKYTAAAAQTGAGLQKWVFDDSLGAWKMLYVLQAGLNLGVPYTVSGYPAGQNSKTALPWSPATDELRNIMGRVNRDGTVTIWAITSTVSGNGDQGADPNQLVMITEHLAATSLPAGERFSAIRTARFGEVLRGVSFTPGTDRERLSDVFRRRGRHPRRSARSQRDRDAELSFPFDHTRLHHIVVGDHSLIVHVNLAVRAWNRGCVQPRRWLRLGEANLEQCRLNAIGVHLERGEVKALECVRMTLGEPDSSGRPSAKPIPGSNVVLPCDQIVKAIGQNKPDLVSRLGLRTENGFISADADFQTSSTGIFAGGDCIRAHGAASTVMAVQDGKLAARSIYRKLVNHG